MSENDYKYGAKRTWELVLDAVIALGGSAGRSAIGRHVKSIIPQFVESNLDPDLRLLSVNSHSRVHWRQNQTPRRTDAGHPYDVLFKRGMGESSVYELYDRSRHGIWEIVQLDDGTHTVRRVELFKVGNSYSRNDIYDLLSLDGKERGGDWLNGYHKHGDEYFVFCNLGVPGRTGHDYDNHWEGGILVWYGKTRSHFGQPTIQNLISGDHRILVFTRSDDRASFVYAGLGKAHPHLGTANPVRIDWSFESVDEPVSFSTDELPHGAKFKEGQRTIVYVNRYERDSRAREACIRHHGTKCSVCDLDFGRVYGHMGQGFIHVHHLKPLSSIGEDYEVDPVSDLLPVCPNCHAMLHKTNPPLEINELKFIISQHSMDASN